MASNDQVRVVAIVVTIAVSGILLGTGSVGASAAPAGAPTVGLADGASQGPPSTTSGTDAAAEHPSVRSASPAMPARQSACEWSAFQRTPAGTAYVPDVRGPTELSHDWERTFEGQAVSGVSAADGRLYGAAAEVFAIDPDTGQTLWTASNEETSGLLPRPVASADRVYLLPNDELVALDADTGGEAWRVSVSDRSFVPTAENGTVYVPTGASLRAYDSADGDRRWTASLAGDVTSVSVVRDGVVYVTDTTGRLTAVDADDGSVLSNRSVDVTGTGVSTLAATDRSVLVANETGIRAVSTVDGTVRWANETIDQGTIAVDEDTDTVYVTVRDGVVAFDTHTGAVQWRQSGVPTPTSFTISATRTNVVVGAGSSVHVLDRETGAVVDQVSVSGTAQTAHVIEDRVYVDFGTTIAAHTGPNVTTVNAPVVGSSLPTDPDCDRKYEDVNGDSDVTPGDATVLFDAVFDRNPATTDNVALFDFNGDGELTPGDATVLFNEAFGG